LSSRMALSSHVCAQTERVSLTFGNNSPERTSTQGAQQDIRLSSQWDNRTSVSELTASWYPSSTGLVPAIQLTAMVQTLFITLAAEGIDEN
ncbi:unnamed protein product, partial [Didymodactylos carnosus]